MVAASRAHWLDLYKNLIRYSKQFSSYNYREYAIRRTRDYFRDPNNKTLSQDQLCILYKKGCENLSSLKRQVIVSQLYAGPKLIIESEDYKL